MKKLAVLGTVAAALTLSLPAVAKEMHCNVQKDHAKVFDGMKFEQKGTSYQLKVKDTFDQTPDTINSNDYNGFINMKWSEPRSSDAKVKYRVRPRKSSECLVKIVDEKGKDVWSGMWCNTGKHKETGSNFDITKFGDSNNPYYVTGGAASTTSKVSYLLTYYIKSGSDYVQVAGCIEDK